MNTFHEEKVLSNQVDKAFIETGYSNWKDAGRGFSNHQASEFHKAAHYALLPGTADVGELLSNVHSEQKKKNISNRTQKSPPAKIQLSKSLQLLRLTAKIII